MRKMSESSDSEHTIILSPDNEPSDFEVESIISKYIGIGSTSTVTTGRDDKSQDENDIIIHKNFIEDTEDVYESNMRYNDIEPILLNNSDEASTSNTQQSVKLKRRLEIENKKNERALEKVRKLQEAEMRKAERNLEKERKKELAEKQKLMKNALKTVAKNTKPEECMKHMIIELDSGVSQDNRGTILKEILQKNDIHFRTKSQVLPNLISWTRKTQSIDNSILKESEVSENNFLIIINEKEFNERVQKDTLTVFLANVFLLAKCKQLTVAVVGLNKPKKTQETAILEAQVMTKSYFRFVRENKDLADLILELTKAVAQIPYKLKKEEKNKLQSEYFSDSNKDTVNVDKNGNGLKRLWHQMLTMFPLASLETAEAITAVYPTPSSLFEAYEICEGKEDLLQNLPIRRALGPCISSRRIGPELSRKCYNFFCATENKLL